MRLQSQRQIKDKKSLSDFNIKLVLKQKIDIVQRSSYGSGYCMEELSHFQMLNEALQSHLTPNALCVFLQLRVLLLGPYLL